MTKQSGFANVVITIVVLLALAAGGIYYWQQSKLPASPEEPIVEGQPPVAPIPDNDETKDWQTYRNEEYGFEVKYPLNLKENCVVEDDFSHNVFCLKDREGKGPYGAFDRLRINIIDAKMWSEKTRDNINTYDELKNYFETLPRTEIEAPSRVDIKTTTGANEYLLAKFCEGGGCVFKTYVILEDGQWLEISYFPSDPQSSSPAPETIFSTFKFIE